MHEFLARSEAVLALLAAKTAVRLLPFRFSAALFGKAAVPCSTATDLDARQLARARAVTGRLRRVANRLPWASTCLERAFAGRMLLARRHLPGGVVRLGVRLDAGRPQAHAWLLVGDHILLGEDEMDGFTPLADLARRGDTSSNNG
ncbi:lasso peptide biosynthesis B2 protein [Magnetospirillum sp. 64-120]|uniref:lasso peptide biosynthesis B2 protein n=1 Tax=Magnetospirillum sp. 64-120 TaxID=1895778 RepID=UPI00092BDB96|nr:lasso peptide biosynthesis B2 protein [Magnetospirillum sp. 64-120]OJX67175.1 MAG: hypothetical protein BGO92_01070 [Magnetospirillum sp. 64-120]